MSCIELVLEYSNNQEMGVVAETYHEVKKIGRNGEVRGVAASCRERQGNSKNERRRGAAVRFLEVPRNGANRGMRRCRELPRGLGNFRFEGRS